MTAAEQLKEFMKSHKMREWALATYITDQMHINISPSTIYNMMKGRHVNTKYWQAVADFMGVAIEIRLEPQP